MKNFATRLVLLLSTLGLLATLRYLAKSRMGAQYDRWNTFFGHIVQTGECRRQRGPKMMWSIPVAARVLVAASLAQGPNLRQSTVHTEPSDIMPQPGLRTTGRRRNSPQASASATLGRKRHDWSISSN